MLKTLPPSVCWECHVALSEEKFYRAAQVFVAGIICGEMHEIDGKKEKDQRRKRRA